MRLLVLIGLCVGALSFVMMKNTGIGKPKEKLSDYNFFVGELNKLQPGKNVVPYTLNSPLFSNYAEKLRFISFPEGLPAVYNDTTVFEFPIGTTLIKNFYYPVDFRKSDLGRTILETRLIVKDENGWQAYPYIWNDEQTEAYYDPAGETRPIQYIDSRGKKVSTQYVIPNKNQCKGCHSSGQDLVPIGTSARQLNHHGQLEKMKELGFLIDLPILNDVPKLAIWDEPASGDLNSRARAYLDSNCGHCHSRTGPASTSGLFLTIFEKDLFRLGVNKSPIAAGRGAGDFKYDIVPGQPAQSILVYRMKTTDPAIAMPEIGREQVHKEAVALIEEWIKKKAYEN